MQLMQKEIDVNCISVRRDCKVKMKNINAIISGKSFTCCLEDRGKHQSMTGINTRCRVIFCIPQNT